MITTITISPALGHAAPFPPGTQCRDSDPSNMPSVQGIITITPPRTESRKSRPSPIIVPASRDHCSEGRLVQLNCPPPGGPGIITTWSDCPSDFVCEDGACQEPPSPQGVCGNGIVEPDEQCDGDLFRLVGGDRSLMCHDPQCDPSGVRNRVEDVLCTSDCRIDDSLCYHGCRYIREGECGNFLVDPGEDCDGGNLGWNPPTCESLGYYGSIGLERGRDTLSCYGFAGWDRDCTYYSVHCYGARGNPTWPFPPENDPYYESGFNHFLDPGEECEFNSYTTSTSVWAGFIRIDEPPGYIAVPIGGPISCTLLGYSEGELRCIGHQLVTTDCR